MSQLHDNVLEFHSKFGLTIEDRPTIPNKCDLVLRANLILEEAYEFAKACGFKLESPRLLDVSEFCDAPVLDEMVDALADLFYVVEGAAITCGVDMDPVNEEVHRANMTKLWSDGKVHYDGGKVIKPPTHQSPDIAKILKEQIEGVDSRPSCADCGAGMVRSDQIYKCVNCGSTSGCS